jgi:Phosphotransferase enzyme family
VSVRVITRRPRVHRSGYCRTVREQIGDQLRTEAITVLGGEPDSTEDLPHGRSPTQQVTRVHVRGRSAVLKVLIDPSEGDEVGEQTDPASLFYWAREPEIYAHGLPDAYRDAGIRPPQEFGRFRRVGGVAMWLENVAGTPGAHWTPKHYRACAQRLGRAQGALLVGDEMSADPVFGSYSRGAVPAWLRIWEHDLDWSILHDESAWRVPLMRRHFSPELRGDLVRLCHERAQLLDWMDRLPQTICHQDVWPKNVFDNGDQTVLIDWAIAGYGAIGLDPGNLVTDSCGDLLHPTSLLPELDAVTTDGYRQGLRDAGWTGNFDLARLGMCCMAAKWCWLTVLALHHASQTEQRVYGQVEVDPDLKYSERAAMLRYYTVLAEEARNLAGGLF